MIEKHRFHNERARRLRDLLESMGIKIVDELLTVASRLDPKVRVKIFLNLLEYELSDEDLAKVTEALVRELRR